MRGDSSEEALGKEVGESGLHLSRNICLPGSGLLTLTYLALTHQTFFLFHLKFITAIARRGGKHQMGASFLSRGPKGQKCCAESLRVNSEVEKLHIFIFH